MKEPTPLLIISDAISAQTGLARITRDLSTRIHEHLGEVYRVGVAGYGAAGSRKFPFPQYNLALDEWICINLPEIVEDFAGREKCKVLFIWDLHRLSWFSQPERLGQESLAKYPGLKQWLLTANIEKWCYVPLDSTGPNDKLSFPIALTAMGFDRLLAFGQFGESLLRRTMGDEESDKRHLTNLPHGIDSSTFYEHNRKASRAFFLRHTGAQSMLHMLGVHKDTSRIKDDEILVNIVATNQSRKDWCLGLECCAILAQDRKIRVWAHVDKLEGAFSIPSLLVDYGLLDKALISLGDISDDRMAAGYSASDLSLGIGLGEGMGYPIHESLFCGTPCLHINYAGAPEWMGNADLLVEPVSYRYEGSFASKRPVCSAQDWADTANNIIGRRCNHNGDIDWANLWPRWEDYLREAAK